MSSDKPRVLVTGANGLLGTAIRKQSKNHEDKYEFSFGTPGDDLTNWKRTSLLIQAYEPEIVIHCAAKVGGVKRNKEQPEEMYYDNIVMNANMVRASAIHGVKKFIGFGSNCAFGEVAELTPASIHTGKPYWANEAYGFAKRMLHIHMRAAKTQYKMDYTYIVPVSMFGPGDNFNLDNGHVIPSLIHKCHLAKDEMEVWGDGSQLREVVFSEDVADIVCYLIGKSKNEVIIGSGQERSIRNMVETITATMDFKGRIRWDITKPAGALKRPPAKSYQWEYTPFEDAIKKTCDWFKTNYPNVRK